MEEISNDTKDAVTDLPLPECLAAILALKRFSISPELLSSSIEMIFATRKKNSELELSKRLR